MGNKLGVDLIHLLFLYTENIIAKSCLSLIFALVPFNRLLVPEFVFNIDLFNLMFLSLEFGYSLILGTDILESVHMSAVLLLFLMLFKIATSMEYTLLISRGINVKI